MTVYTYQSFSYFGKKIEEKRRRVVIRQNVCLFSIHFLAYMTGFLITGNENLVLLYGAQVVYFILTITFFQIAYPEASRMLMSHMCMLLAIGFFMLTRLQFGLAVKQFIIVVAGTICVSFIPFIMQKMKILRNMAWVYGVVGIVLLAIVLATAPSTNGAKLFLSLGPISFQPSEFVKIIFVFFVAAVFEKGTGFWQVLKTAIVAACHVLLLVFSKDLGGALIFALIYILMVYVATKKSFYLFGGLLVGSGAACIAYRLFDHVKTRVTAWIDPWSVIDTKGYQIAQSLFAIGTGGWLGLGLYQGSPGQIPIVEQDFIFSAIAEELGGIVGICVILICLGCLLLFLNIALQSKSNFYRLMALGLACTYGIQVFLTIGGALKFIPSTGVTLPLISYGGSSMLSTLAVFAIVQGLYTLKGEKNRSEEIDNEEIA